MCQTVCIHKVVRVHDHTVYNIDFVSNIVYHFSLPSHTHIHTHTHTHTHTGLSLHTFHGNIFVRSTDLLSLPNVNPDHGFTMNLAIDESLKDVSMACFQAALLYTSSRGGPMYNSMHVDCDRCKQDTVFVSMLPSTLAWDNQCLAQRVHVCVSVCVCTCHALGMQLL